MSDAPVWLSEADVAPLLDMRTAIAVIRDGYLGQADGTGKTMDKTHVSWGAHGLHAIGGAVPKLGYVGTKTWAHTAGGASPLLILFDADTGAVRAIMEAFVLGRYRTAATTGLATSLLAGSDADVLAIAGSGRQALAQVEAVHTVRPLQRVCCYSPNEVHCDEFAQRVYQTLGIPATAFHDIEECLDGASIVTLATRARTPFVTKHAVASGAHVNAIGAITPERAEFVPSLLDRCGAVVTDTPSQARRLAREFMERWDGDESGWGAVLPLANVVASGEQRPPGADVTLFKALGLGLSDVVLGGHVFDQATELGVGRPIPVGDLPKAVAASEPMGGAR